MKRLISSLYVLHHIKGSNLCSLQIHEVTYTAVVTGVLVDI